MSTSPFILQTYSRFRLTVNVVYTHVDACAMQLDIITRNDWYMGIINRYSIYFGTIPETLLGRGGAFCRDTQILPFIGREGDTQLANLLKELSIVCQMLIIQKTKRA